MRRPIVAAACCLAVSTSSLLGGCAASPEPTTGQPEPAEATQDAKAASGAPAASHAEYKDGSYTGTGRGMGGDITVALTVAEGVITVDDISESGETPGVGGKEAIEDGTFAAQIEEAQSAEIDGVTGATMTSGGVAEAVEKALSQAQ